MPIFASTTTSGYSDPMRALSIKALEQRMKDMQTQQASQQAGMFTPENTQTPIQGIGQVANLAADRFSQHRADSALAAQKQELANVMSGVDWDKGPTAPQIAQMNRFDPELTRQALTTLAENRRAREQNAVTARGQDVTARGQDVVAGTTARGQDVTARGQDIVAGTTQRGQDITARGQDVVSADTRRGQDVTVRGQDMTQDSATRGQDITARGQDTVAGTTTRGQDVTARGQDIAAGTTTRGQDIVAGTTQRGQDVTARGQDITAGTTTRGQDIAARGQDMTQDSATRGQDVTARGQDIGADTARRGQDMTQDSATRGQDVTVRGQDMTRATTERGQDLSNRVKMDDLTKGAGIQSDYARHAQALDNLSEARALLKDGINSGFWGNARTKAAQIAEGRWGTDKDAADRTTRFNQLMDEQAITKMAAQLKGQTTNFEMSEFQKIVNNPNVPFEKRLEALDRLISQASVDRNVHASAATAAQKQIGGPTVEEIDATLKSARGGGAGGGLQEAQDAINQGAPFDQVAERAKAAGLDVSGLKPKGR